MKIKSIVFATFAFLGMFSSNLLANVNVLIIGSTRDSGEKRFNGGWSTQKPPFPSNSKPFSPTQVGTYLQSILAQDGRGAINVTAQERYATQALSIGWTAYSYNLAAWFHYPFPAGRKPLAGPTCAVKRAQRGIM